MGATLGTLSTLALALVGAIPGGPAPDSQPLADGATVRLALSLRQRDPEGLRQLLVAQQDPSSLFFHAWLTPAEFGARFGQPRFSEIVAWVAGQGLQVVPSPNRIFFEATGTSAQVRALLGVQPRESRRGGRVYRTLAATDDPSVPSEFADAILRIDGLRALPPPGHRFALGQDLDALGPADLRRFYDMDSLLDQGFTGRGAKLAVLGPQMPSNELPELRDIAYFDGNASDSAAQLVERTLPNPNGDLDFDPGARSELEMDVEFETVAAPDAASVTLVLAPSSELFTTGMNDLACNLPDVAAVSVSFEGVELQGDRSSALAAQQFVAQGSAEGQSWFSATGDRGAEGEGALPGARRRDVDFPADIPELVAVGGTEARPDWSPSGAVTGYSMERVWNMGREFGAGGGGVSLLFGKPPWQDGVTPPDGARDLPDIALFAAPSPGLLCDADRLRRLGTCGGTSVSAPLAAGIFALLGDRLGGRLGGVNPVLYRLGQAQLHGGPVVFHDITRGDIGFDGVQGAAAGPGYDLATGWGSLDVAALARAWPMAPPQPLQVEPRRASLTPAEQGR